MRKLISILLAALMVAALIVPVNAEFEVHVENEAVAYLVNEVWTNCDFTEKEGGGLFGADASCTRAEAVTFLWRDAGGGAE